MKTKWFANAGGAAVVVLMGLLIGSCATEEAEYHAQGMDELNAGRYRAALVRFGRAIDLNAEDADPYMGRGYAKLLLGDYRGAARDFEQAINLDPKRCWRPLRSWTDQSGAWRLSECHRRV